MASLPSATTSIATTGGVSGASTDYLALAGCVGTNADGIPRVYGSAQALIDQHGYSPAVSYAALHIKETKKPLIFTGLPVVTAAVLGSEDTSAWTGTSIPSVAAGAAGYLEELDAIVEVDTAGTVGTAPGPVLNLSLDGGWTYKKVRLGTATSYTIPYVGAVLSFTVGTMIADNVYSFRTTAPMWDSAGITALRTALAAQQKQARSWLIVGDLPNSTFAGYLTTAANTYETSHKRYIYARTQVQDRRLAKKARRRKAMVTASGATLTFADVGASDTITRSAGSWLADGFVVGDTVTVAGAVASAGANNVTGVIAALSATVLTFGAATPLVAEGPITGCTVVGSETVTFAEVGAGLDTITRSTGSWTADGFAVGQQVNITGTVSNNFSGYTITALSATVMTFGAAADDLAAEVIAGHLVSVVQAQTFAAYVSAQDAAFSSVDAQKRVDISIGRARKLCEITGYEFRRPCSWAASLREYQHDVHIPCWRVDDNPLDGWRLTDRSNTVVELDQRSTGGMLEARFTCFTTMDNGPEGAFIGLSLTRDTDNTTLSRTHNMAVANVGCSVVQAEATRAIGQVLVLKDDGTGNPTEESLGIIEDRVNGAVAKALLQAGKEGKRASNAVWAASRSDDLRGAGATLNNTLHLVTLGTLEHINTSVVIST